jgi:Wax ester synthase-like Acyl-CoA acyltransferase domain
LYDLAARLMQDAFDRTRPLWLFVIVDGLEGGRGAMFAKLHHTIADGYAALGLTELYLTLDRFQGAPAGADSHPCELEVRALARSGRRGREFESRPPDLVKGGLRRISAVGSGDASHYGDAKVRCRVPPTTGQVSLVAISLLRSA